MVTTTLKSSMKNLILLLLTFIAIASCNTSDDAGNLQDYDLEGTWKLTANLADPGDGSGTFQTVNSNKTITFNSDGTYTSTGDMCNISIGTTTATSGTYDTVGQTINSSCGTNNLPISYEINGSILEITYLCIEPCKSRYSKVN